MSWTNGLKIVASTALVVKKSNRRKVGQIHVAVSQGEVKENAQLARIIAF
jgi:hypothetical protein